MKEEGAQAELVVYSAVPGIPADEAREAEEREVVGKAQEGRARVVAVDLVRERVEAGAVS